MSATKLLRKNAFDVVSMNKEQIFTYYTVYTIL